MKDTEDGINEKALDKLPKLDTDLVARKVLIRRDRWGDLIRLGEKLAAERGIKASVPELAAIVLEAGLAALSAPAPKTTEREALMKRIAELENAREIQAQAVCARADERDAARAALSAFNPRRGLACSRCESLEKGNAQLKAEREAAIARAKESEAERDEAVNARAACMSVDAEEKLKEDLEAAQEKVSELKGEVETLESAAEDHEEALEDAKKIPDLRTVAGWVFEMGGQLWDLLPLVTSSEASDVIQAAYQNAVPQMPAECFAWRARS